MNTHNKKKRQQDMSFLFKARRGRNSNATQNAQSSTPSSSPPSPSTQQQQQKTSNKSTKGTENGKTTPSSIVQEDLTKMYEQMYEQQDKIIVEKREADVTAAAAAAEDARSKQAFIAFRNPLYMGQFDDSNEYEEEPDEEELFWKRKQEEEERRKNKKLRRMNVTDVEYVPIKLQVNERKLIQVGQVVSSKFPSKVESYIQSKRYNGEEMLQKSTKEALLAINTDTPLDELFEDAQYSLAGIMIWHINGMTPLLVEEDDYGTFYSGDCYIVMKTFDAQDEEERLRIIFTWMGEDTNWKKRAICAFLVKELTNKLTTGMKRLRMERQYEESAEFREVFGKNAHLKYNKGSISEETLRPCLKSDSNVNSPEILTFSWRKSSYHTILQPVVIRVPWSKRFSSEYFAVQNVNSAFIVNTRDHVYVWIGSQCVQSLSIKILDVATQLMYEEHKAEGQLVVISQGQEPEDFLKLLPQSSKVPDFSESHLNNEVLLFRVGLNEETKQIDVTPVKDFKYVKSIFETHYCYLVETQFEVYGWMGPETLPLERRYLKHLLEEIPNGKDKAFISTSAFFDGNEPVLFKERFSDYYVSETREAFEKKREQLSNISKQKLSIDTVSYFEEYSSLDREAERQKKLIDELDDGSGPVQVWRVIDSDLAEPVPEDEIGNFYTGECYLILYEFNRNDMEAEEDEGNEEGEKEEEDEEEEDEDAEYKDYDYSSQEEDEVEEKQELVTKSKDVKNKRIAYLTRKILYCWEGAESDKKVAARILKENFKGFATDAINPAVVITLHEGKESKHFMRVFEHIMTIHRGCSTDKRESYDGSLFRIYCKIDPVDNTDYNSKAVEVPRRKSSLNSNDIYVLVAARNAYVWVGMYASTDHKKVAFKLAQTLITGNKRVLAIDENMEPEEFWEDLGQISVNDTYPVDKINYKKGNVYECTITSENKFRIMDIGKVGENILQPDLADCHYPLIFDYGRTIYIWYPQVNTDPAVKYLVRHAVYELTLPEDNKDEQKTDKPEKTLPNFYEVCVAGTPNVVIYEEYRGKETPEFKMIFPMWRHKRIFLDHFAIEKQMAEEERNAAILQALPFVEIMREKHPYLMQEDEYANVHNAVELIKIGIGAKTNFDIIINELCKLDIYDFSNDLDNCNAFGTDLMKFCLTGIKKKPVAKH